MNLDDAIDRFIKHRQTKNVVPETVRMYTSVLARWQKWRLQHNRPGDLDTVSSDDLIGFLAFTVEAGRKPNTVDSYRRILRAFWRYLEGELLLTDEQLHFWSNNRIPRPLGIELEARPYCDTEQFDSLLAAAGDGADEESARNRAILLLLWESGARVSELCTLTDGQVDMKQRQANILGKGRKRGYIFWGPRAGAAILRYMQLRRGDRGGLLPLFRGVSSRNNGGAMTANAVRLMIKRLGVALPKGAPCHWLRHAFAHRNLDAGLDASQVQQLMRHSSIDTTLRYLKERPDKLQELHRRGLGLADTRPGVRANEARRRSSE